MQDKRVTLSAEDGPLGFSIRGGSDYGLPIFVSSERKACKSLTVLSCPSSHQRLSLVCFRVCVFRVSVFFVCLFFVFFFFSFFFWFCFFWFCFVFFNKAKHSCLCWLTFVATLTNLCAFSHMSR